MHVNTFVFPQIPIFLFVVLILYLLSHRHVSRGAGRNLQICISKSTGPQWRHFSNDPPSFWASLATHAEQRSTCGKAELPGLALTAHPSVCMCMCVQVQGLQQCCGAYETRALDERRVERFTVCERESRLNHSSTAACNSPATETADIAAATVYAARALIRMHAHTHAQDFLVCLRNVRNRANAKMQLLTEKENCDPGRLSCSRAAIMARRWGFVSPTDLSG